MFVQGCDQYFYGNGGSGVIQSLNFDQPSATYVATLAGTGLKSPSLLDSHWQSLVTGFKTRLSLVGSVLY